jgi:hypothetical protein
MKPPSTKNSRRAPTTAANLALRFEAGRSKLDYFDPAHAVLTHGVARPKAQLRAWIARDEAEMKAFQAAAKTKR